MFNSLVDVCADRWIIVAVFSAMVMMYLGSKQYKLLGNGEVRRCFKDRFYEILSVLMTIVNWPLFAMRVGDILTALQKEGIDEVLLNVEEDRLVGTVAIMLFAFPIIFFLLGKLASLVKLGYYYDWDEVEDIIQDKQD